MVRQYLEERHIEYEAQYKIRTSPNMIQRIDVFIPSYNIAIEYNGRQHYEENPFFHGARKKKKIYTLNKTRQNDCRKAEWCCQNGIDLIVIDGRNWDRRKNFPHDEFMTFIDGLLGKKLRGTS